MIRYLLPTLGIASTVWFGQAATANTVGPVRDSTGVVDVGSPLPQNGTIVIVDWQTQWTNPFTGAVHKDGIKVTYTYSDRAYPGPVHVGGIAYGVYGGPGYTGALDIYTIYGVDLNPGGSALQMTGLNASQDAALSFANETFYGNSGTAYHAGSAVLGGPRIRLGDLPTALAGNGFDPLPFTGDANSYVYAFRTTVPSSDFSAVPLPKAVFAAPLLGLGLIFHGIRRRRALRLA